MNALGQELYVLLQSSANLQAFLRVIRHGESSQDDRAYRTIVGGGQATSLADHPRQLVYLPNLKVSSTAAGAYQFLSRTWDGCVKALDLPDFSPKSQDTAAVYLIRGRKALQAVLDGDVRGALQLCALEWASLPGSPYGQPVMTLATALQVYQKWNTGAPPAPSTPSPQQETPVAPLIPFLATTLIDIFAPIAREKLTKEMGRHTDNPQVAESIAEGVINAAKAVSGKEDPLEAVAAVRNEPALVQRVEAMSMEQLDGVLVLAERMAKIDEASVAAARNYARTDDFVLNTRSLRLKFIHLLSLMFVSFAGWFVTHTWETLTPELRGAVITLMVIAGWNGVKDFWMGSSDGSQRKTAEIMRLKRE